MNLPKDLKAKYLARFEDLIEEGRRIIASLREIPEGTGLGQNISGWAPNLTSYDWDRRQLSKWRVNCLTLLEPFGHRDTRLKEHLDFFSTVRGYKQDLQSCLGILEALREDLEKGFLDDLALRIEGKRHAMPT